MPMKNSNLILPFLKLCLTDTKKVIRNMVLFTRNAISQNNVIKKYGLSKGLRSIDIVELFPQLEDSIKNYTYLDGTSKVIDIMLLKQFAKLFPEGRYIEFGTWRGESVSNIAPLVKEAYTISFSDDEMRNHHKVSESAIKVSKLFSKNIANVVNIEHNSHTFDFAPYYNKFDFVFIDADHTSKGVRIDTSNAFKLLKDEKSIIVWHDYGLTFELPNWEVLEGIMDGTPEIHRKNIYHISNTLCAVYMKGSFKADYPEIAVPTKKFEIHLKSMPV